MQETDTGRRVLTRHGKLEVLLASTLAELSKRLNTELFDTCFENILTSEQCHRLHAQFSSQVRRLMRVFFLFRWCDLYIKRFRNPEIGELKKPRPAWICLTKSLFDVLKKPSPFD